MKVFQNNSIFKKIVIVFLIIMSFSFCMPKDIKADDDDSSIGGTLLNPIMSLFVGLGDGAMSLLQKVVLNMDDSIIEIDSSSSFWAKVIVVLTCIAVVAVIVIATVATAGAARSYNSWDCSGT